MAVLTISPASKINQHRKSTLNEKATNDQNVNFHSPKRIHEKIYIAEQQNVKPTNYNESRINETRKICPGEHR